MNDNLSCTLVRDLLPSYLEGLTAEETNEALETHLKTCPACAAALEAMKDAAGAAETAEQPREVDYLRRVKRQNRKRVIVSVIATALGLLLALLIRVLVIGTPLQAQTVAVLDAREDHGRLRLSISSVGSGNAYHGWKVETVDGVASIYARDVLVSPLYSSGDAVIHVPLDGVNEVWLGGISGRLVWQDGMIISQQTRDLLELKTPYCGAATALGNIAWQLQLPELGKYTVSMHTSAAPYRWTLEFEESLSASGQSRMQRAAYVMLALVENLDEVSYTWKDASGGMAGSVVLFRDSAGRRLRELTGERNTRYGSGWEEKDSIKDYAENPADFQRLLELLEAAELP